MKKFNEVGIHLFIITGGGTGIGKSLALNLADRGERILIVGRREQPLKDTSKLSENIEYISADITSLDEQQKVVDVACEITSNIKGLVHNAGTIMPIETITKISKDDWLKTLATNVEPALFLTQSFYPYMSGGRVLNISSGAAHFPVKGWAAYCVSKAALSMLTRCWQMDIDNLYVASVMPGIIDTDMQNLIRHTEHMDSEKLDFFKKLKQNNQLITPETTAAFLSWLLIDVSPEQFISKEWDIYDTEDQPHWLKSPYQVPPLEE